MKTGTICDVTYGWETISETFSRPVFETGMFLRTTDDGREEVLFPDLRIIHAPSSKVSIRSFTDSPFYSRVRAELFPSLAIGAEHEISEGVMAPDEGIAA